MKERGSPQEVAFILFVAFGWFIIASIISMVLGRTTGEAGDTSTYADKHLVGVLIVEMMLAPLVCWLLYIRGWRDADFPMGFSTLATVVGIAAAALAYAVDTLLTLGLEVFFPTVRSALETLEQYKPGASPRLITILSVSVFNSFYEELFVCAYVIEALRKRFGDTVAVNVSIVVRASYHLYQGLAAMPFHLVYGFMNAYLYLRVRRVWPLVVSHAILNFIAFTALG
jgi:membrane protease YdiL (CAAX protease family)